MFDWATAAVDLTKFFYGNTGHGRKNQRQQTREDAGANILGRLDAAKAAGIHPALALGAPAFSSSVPSYPGTPSLNSYDPGFDDPPQKPMNDQEFEWHMANQRRGEIAREDEQRYRQLQLDNMSLRNDQIRSQIAASEQARARQAMESLKTTRATAEDGPIPMWVPARDKDGTVKMLPNPDLYGLELPETYGAYTLHERDVNNMMDRVGVGDLTTPGGAGYKLPAWARNLLRRSSEGKRGMRETPPSKRQLRDRRMRETGIPWTIY